MRELLASGEAAAARREAGYRVADRPGQIRSRVAPPGMAGPNGWQHHTDDHHKGDNEGDDRPRVVSGEAGQV
jgi:hypothetical protein